MLMLKTIATLLQTHKNEEVLNVEWLEFTIASANMGVNGD